MRTQLLVMAAAGSMLSGCSDAGIVSPPVEPETVQVTYCAGLEPTWVAFQDGDGPWTRAAPTASAGGQTFQYAFQANRGGVATLSVFGGGLTVLAVFYGTPAELATLGYTRDVFCGPPVSKTLLGTVVGLDTNQTALASSGVQSHSVASITDQQGTRLVTVGMTAAYAAHNGAGYDLVVPDLSAAAGFDPAWALHTAAQQLIWTANRLGGTLDLGGNPVLSDGATRRAAFVMDSIPAS